MGFFTKKKQQMTEERMTEQAIEEQLAKLKSASMPPPIAPTITPPQQPITQEEINNYPLEPEQQQETEKIMFADEPKIAVLKVKVTNNEILNQMLDSASEIVRLHGPEALLELTILDEKRRENGSEVQMQ